MSATAETYPPVFSATAYASRTSTRTAHVSQLPHAGDFLDLDLLGEPLIVVRGKGRGIRALSRVCPHRAMDIMPTGFGYDGHGPAEARPGMTSCDHTRIFLCPRDNVGLRVALNLDAP